MTSLLSCLLSFRSSYQIAIADISKMFHALSTGKKTNNLRRVWVKRGGMGSDSNFEIARFVKVSFGDLLTPAFAIVALGLAIMMFIKNESLREQLPRAIYMDDIQVESKGPHENMDELQFLAKNSVQDI